MRLKLIRKRIVIVLDLQRPRDWRDDVYNLRQFDAWDLSQRQARGWLAGLAFWQRTNVPYSRVLVARHWPHLLCWSWSCWLGLHRPGFDGPRRLTIVVERGRSIELRLFGPWLRWSRQDYGHMGKRDCGAPEIVWQHHLRQAQPAGHA